MSPDNEGRPALAGGLAGSASPASIDLVYATCPDLETAERIARVVVAGRLAACVNIVADVVSVFRWEGDVMRAQECILIAKTGHAQSAQLIQAIVAAHPYDVPAVVAIPLDRGYPAFFDWVATETHLAPVAPTV